MTAQDEGARLAARARRFRRLGVPPVLSACRAARVGVRRSWLESPVKLVSSAGEDGAMSSARDTALDLISFIDASPSPYHAAAEALRRLTGAGFTEVAQAQAWPSGPGRYVVAEGGSLFAWVVPEGAAPAPGSGCSARIPTARRCGSSPARIPAGPVCGSSASRSTAARCSIRGWIATWGWPAGWWYVRRTVSRCGWCGCTGPCCASRSSRSTWTPLRADGLKLDAQQHVVPIWSPGDPIRAGSRASWPRSWGCRPPTC